MRFHSRVISALVAMLTVATGSAHATHLGTGRPDCVSAAGVAPSSSSTLTDFTTHGFGGGFIGSIPLPAVTGVIPAPSAQEADVVGALMNLSFLGVLGGGTTTLRPIAGLPGATQTLAGAQIVTAGLFTGHFKAVPRTYECESVVVSSTIVTHSYFEITISGLLTPLAAGSPLSSYAQGTQVTTQPGDNAPD